MGSLGAGKCNVSKLYVRHDVIQVLVRERSVLSPFLGNRRDAKGGVRVGRGEKGGGVGVKGLTLPTAMSGMGRVSGRVKIIVGYVIVMPRDYGDALSFLSILTYPRSCLAHGGPRRHGSRPN